MQCKSDVCMFVIMSSVTNIDRRVRQEKVLLGRAFLS
jgi:hypothetical protein